MSDNPYQQNPNQPNQPPHGGDVSGADKVKTPGILLVLAGIVSGLSGVLSGASITALFWGMKDEIRKEMENEPDMTPELFEAVISFYGFSGITLAFLSLLAGIIMVMGGMKMMQQRSWGFAMFASIVALVPCVQGCCLLALPVGIYAIITLNDDQVKRSFR